MTSESPRPLKRIKTYDDAELPTDGNTDKQSQCSPNDYPNLLFDNNFQHRMKDKSCFVDKSMFIEEVVQSSHLVNVILRPPRFGKSLNLSMLQCFFDVNSPDRHMFNGLLIEKHHPEYFGPDGPFGSHPVIHVDLKREISCVSAAPFWGTLAKLYKQFNYLLQSNELNDDQKLEYKKSGPVTTESIRVLSRLLHLHHKSPCVILVDNYDSFLHDFKRNVDDDVETASFLEDWFSSFIVDNEPNVFKVVIMGVCNFSCWDEINNRVKAQTKNGDSSSKGSPSEHIGVCTWKQAEFSDHFGFSEDEVTHLLKNCYGCTALCVFQVLSFYSGYRTRKGLSMSNPYSIMKYLTDRSIKPYLSKEMVNACKTLDPLILSLLKDASTPSPTKGVPLDFPSSHCLGPCRHNVFCSQNDGGLKALFFGFVGLSDEENLHIPTFEALHYWIERVLSSSAFYQWGEVESLDEFFCSLFEKFFKTFNTDSLTQFDKAVAERIRDSKAEFCIYLFALALTVDALTRGMHTNMCLNSETDALRVVIVSKSRGCIFHFAMAKFDEKVDKVANVAMGTPTQAKGLLKDYPDVHEAFQVGIGMKESKSFVAAQLLVKCPAMSRLASGWSIKNKYDSSTRSIRPEWWY